MSKKFNLLIGLLPFIDVCIGFGMLALVNAFEAQTEIMRGALGASHAVEGVFPMGALYFIVKFSAWGLITISILKALVSYNEQSKSL